MYVAGKTIPYYTGRKHYWFVPPKIPGYFGSFRQFRRIPVCFDSKLIPGRYKMNEVFFFLSIFGTYISLSLECWMTMIVQISACWIIPHFFFLLSSFNRPDGSGGLSFLFLFSFQWATPYFLYILERQSHFILKWDKFSFFGQKGERIGTCTSTRGGKIRHNPRIRHD